MELILGGQPALHYQVKIIEAILLVTHAVLALLVVISYHARQAWSPTGNSTRAAAALPSILSAQTMVLLSMDLSGQLDKLEMHYF